MRENNQTIGRIDDAVAIDVAADTAGNDLIVAIVRRQIRQQVGKADRRSHRRKAEVQNSTRAAGAHSLEGDGKQPHVTADAGRIGAVKFQSSGADIGRIDGAGKALLQSGIADIADQRRIPS